MRPSVVYKDSSAQITCPPAYLEKSPKLQPLAKDADYKKYSMGIIVDYLILNVKQNGLVDCIAHFNATHK